MTLRQRMSLAIGGTSQTTKPETHATTPIERTILAKQQHIAEIKADRFYNRVADAQWIRGIQAEIRALRAEGKSLGILA